MKTIVLAVLVCASCRDASVSPPGPPNGAAVATISITSGTFAAGAAIPKDNTCDGSDQSPELSWSALPDAAKSIVIVLDDPDAPSGTFTHWMVWNIKEGTRVLGAGGNGGYAGGMAGTNDFGHIGYSGPCPPKGSLHHYHVRIYGLNLVLALKTNDKRGDLDRAMNGHVIAQGDLVGTYEH